MAFSFGSAAPSSAPNNNNAAPAPSFSFGSNPATTPASGSTLNFSAPAPAPVGTQASTSTSAGGPSFGGAPAASATPAAGGGFSFGGTPAPAAAGGGGFSFGGTPAPAPKDAAPEKKDGKEAATTTTTAGGGFSFGGASENDASTSNVAAASSTAPVATPQTTTGIAGSTPTTATTSQPQPQGPPPKTYQNQTLEHIINSLSQNLESHTSNFLAQSQRIAAQDEILRNSQHSISTLTNEISKLLIQHEDLDLRLNQVNDLYTNTDSVLDSLEKQVDVLFENCVTTIDDGDIERERYYNLAMEVDGRLHRIDDEVCDLEQIMEGLMNRGIGSNGGSGGGGDVADIVKVLNRQNEMLNGLEVSCEKMESELNLVSRVVLDR